MVNIESTGRRQLSENDLIRLEEEIGRPLPAQYRSFLLVHNGGLPSPDIIDITGAHFRATDVQVFHGIDTPIESSDLRWNLENVEWCKDHELLPIARDSCGRTFILVLTPEEYGQVYYYDMEESVLIPYFVAHDFNEFLGKIRDLTPEELADSEASITADS